jgi:hydroxymethylglutaryl-CoA synthase
VRLEDWCEWTGAPYGKISKVVGRSFRMCSPHENVYTMAANAVVRLINAYDIDPMSVGFLGFGTESSTDNSAGGVIVKGMVDRALEMGGRPPLSRTCEAPEFKQACLGGVYALKGALRYLAYDGGGRKGIVVSGDVAEYERGSTGEQTQGAGAVAFLVEEQPTLFSADLGRCGSAAEYRGPDFRKPMARYFMDGYAPTNGRLHDFPIFNGKYSTRCYVDQVVHAVSAMLERTGEHPRAYFENLAAVLFHRPYHRMPIQAMAVLLVWGLGLTEDGRDSLRRACKEAEIDFDAIMRELSERPRLFDTILDQGVDAEPWAQVERLAGQLRRIPRFAERIDEKLGLGADLVMDLGNLYTASLPAWVASAFEDALARGMELEGRDLVLIGYGSGDAAEAIPVRVTKGWREAARKIQLAKALEDPVDLSREQYEELHDHGQLNGLKLTPRQEFVIDHIGQSNDAKFQDLGIEYYRYVP